MKETKTIVNDLSDYVNTYSDKSKEFNEMMGREHRTLQQSFTRLCLAWLEYVGSDQYRFDGRNESSHKTIKIMLEGYKKNHPNPDYYLDPSKSLPFI